MTSLKDVNYLLLTEAAIQLLARRKITFVLDFLKEETFQLVKISKLSFQEIYLIKQYLHQTIGAQPVNGLEFVKKYSNIKLSTGIKSFNHILKGGLSPRHIYEIYGASTAGKTQICFTIVCHFARHEHETFYIDTKHDFSAQRLYQILSGSDDIFPGANRNNDHLTVLKRIRCERVNTIFDVFVALKWILKNVEKYPKMKLIVIDSICSDWHFTFGNNTADGNRFLAEMVTVMRKLTFEHDFIIITVNLPSKSASDSFPKEDLANNYPLNSLAIMPMLGRYWQSTPSTRFLVHEYDRTVVGHEDRTQSVAKKRKIVISKSTEHKTGTWCLIDISNKGVR